MKPLPTRVASATVLAAALSLAACTSPTEVADDLAQNMGSASPVASPPATDPDGEVIAFAPVRDLDTTGDLVAVRTDDAVHVGTVEQLRNNTAVTYPTDASCGEVSANAGTFALACGSQVRLFDASGETTLEVEEPATAAVVTSSGEVVTASDAQRKVWVYRDGKKVDTISVARETDQLIAMQLPDQDDAVVRINRFDTTIQDVDWSGGRQGGTLRVGLGVGKIDGTDGVVLAADATGSQLFVYNTMDIIRLHQTAPVAQGPWDVTWDAANKLAWTTSTADNTATGYDLSGGVPVQKAQVATVADPQSIISLDDATLIIASATGDGIQIVKETL